MNAAMNSCQQGIMIVVIPLLVEKKLWEPFDRAIVVDCEVENQLSRLMSREKISKEKAKIMLMAQATREERLQLENHLPTDIIENNSKISDLKVMVKELNKKLLSLL
jgi:dephospho-CoA kinase